MINNKRQDSFHTAYPPGGERYEDRNLRRHISGEPSRGPDLVSGAVPDLGNSALGPVIGFDAEAQEDRLAEEFFGLAELDLTLTIEYVAFLFLIISSSLKSMIGFLHGSNLYILSEKENALALNLTR